MSFFYETPLEPIAPTFGGGETPFGDLMQSSRDVQELLDNLNGSESALEDAYDTRIAAIKSATGISLDNPVRQREDVTFHSEGLLGRDDLRGDPEEQHRNFATRLQELEVQFPQHADAIRAGVSVRDDAAKLARGSEQDFNRLFGSRSDFFGKWSAVLAGGVLGMLRDPVQIATVFVGGGVGAARTTGGRIATVALKEVLINSGFEAAQQPVVQTWRKRVGAEHGFDQAVQNVVFAGATAGVLGAAGQGAIEGVRTLLRGKDLDTAADAGARSLPEDSKTRAGLEGDGEAAGELVTEIRDVLDDAGRGAVDAREADQVTGSQKPEGVSQEDFDQVTSDAVRFAEDPDNNPPPRMEEGSLVEDVGTRMRRELASQRPAKSLRPHSLLRFLANNGGIRDEGGELAKLDLTTLFVPGSGRLVRKGGLSLDRAREMAAEAGYMSRFGTPEQAIHETTVADFLDHITEDNTTHAVFSEFDGDRVAGLKAQEVFDDKVAQLDRALGELDDTLTDDLPLEIKQRAVEISLEGDVDALDALERSILEDYYANGAPGPVTRSDGADIEVPFFDETNADRPGSQGQRPGDAGTGGDVAGGRREPADAGADSPAPGRAGEAAGKPRSPEGGLDDPSAPEIAAETDQFLADNLTDDLRDRQIFLETEDGAGREITVSKTIGEAFDEADRTADLADLVETCKV